MPVTAETSRRLANDLEARLMDKKQIKHEVWAVPEPFRAMQYISNARYMTGNTILQRDRLKKPKKNNVRFCKVGSYYPLKIF